MSPRVCVCTCVYLTFASFTLFIYICIFIGEVSSSCFCHSLSLSLSLAEKHISRPFTRSSTNLKVHVSTNVELTTHIHTIQKSISCTPAYSREENSRIVAVYRGTVESSMIAGRKELLLGPNKKQTLARSSEFRAELPRIYQKTMYAVYIRGWVYLCIRVYRVCIARTRFSQTI